MQRSVLFILILICVCDISVAGDWHFSELCTIGWGNESNQLYISPAETTDSGFPEMAEGPGIGFIDRDENIIICSSETFQLKGFSNTGHLLFDYSFYSPDYNPEMYKETPGKIYIDSLQHIYVLSDTPITYIPVLDYEGGIIEKIRPFPQDQSAYIDFMNWSPSGTLLFFNWNYGWVQYIDSKSTSGGNPGFPANNGKYYSVYNKTPDSLEFTCLENPDSKGLTDLKHLTEVEADIDGITDAEIIDGGDGNNLYVYLIFAGRSQKQILEFNLRYEIIDRLMLTDGESFGDFNMTPFIRSDGKIYEFLFREDGLHVKRWSKN